MPEQNYDFADLEAHALLEERLEQIHSAIAETLSRDDIWEAGRTLDLLMSDTDEITEDQLEVLLAWAIYGEEIDGRTRLQRWAAGPEAKEIADPELLDALQSARFTILSPQSFKPPFGLEVSELTTGKTFFLFDPFLSEIEEEDRDFVLATWVLTQQRTTTTNTLLMIAQSDDFASAVKDLETTYPQIAQGGLKTLTGENGSLRTDAAGRLISYLLREDLLLGFEMED